MLIRYSRWDGLQDVPGLAADEALEELSDDILAHGDLDAALPDPSHGRPRRHFTFTVTPP